MVRLEDLKPCSWAKGVLPDALMQVIDAKWHGSSARRTTATGVIALAYITATNPGSALLDANKNHRGRHMERVECMKLLGHVCFKGHGIGDDGNGRRKRARSSWIFPKPTRFVSAKRMAKLPVLGATARLVLYPEAPR